MELFDHFIVRTPLLPYQTSTEEPFRLFAESPLAQEAIYLSSHALFDKIWEVLEGKITNVYAIDKIEHSLLKYLKRISYRPTPYGLNAGVSIGIISDTTDILLPDPEQYKRVIRFDMSFLGRIHREMIASDEIKSLLRWYPNNSIYKVENQYRYYEYHYLDNHRHYQLSQTASNDIIDSLLLLASEGVLIENLVSDLLKKGFHDEEIKLYIDELIDARILISELEPSVSGLFYGEKLKHFFSRYDGLDSPVAHMFNRLDKDLEKLHWQTGTSNLSQYQSMSRFLKDNKMAMDDLLQIDLLKELSHNTISDSLFSELKESFELVNAFNKHVKYPQRLALEDFVKEFEKRYEGMEIPLNIALDPDLGIGYPVSTGIESDDELSDQLDLSSERSILYDYRNSFNLVLKKYYQCISSNGDEIEFTEQERKALVSDSTFDAGIITSMVSVVNRGDQKDLIHLGTEPVGISLSARFAHISENFLELHREICEAEAKYYEDFNTIVAEVVFEPTDRGGNIVSKPHLRKYEIPIITLSTLPKENIIPLDDILISVRSRHIVLRSKSRSVNIIPRFSSAYSHKSCRHPIFNFLNDLKYSACNGTLNWSWGILANMPHLPRVRYKNVILSRAKWVVQYSEFTGLPGDDDLVKLQHVLSKRVIPTRFCLSQMDDFLLPLDLSSTVDQKMFLTEIRKHKSLTLLEDVFAGEKNLLIKDRNNGFTNEFVVYWNNLDSLRTVRYFSNSYAFKSQKVITPGNEWLYFSIFCGERIADKIIKEDIYDVIKDFKKNGRIESWFFIRYAQPSFHIRLRVRLPNSNEREVEKALRDKLSNLHQTQQIWDIKEEVYNRELNRYGDLNIENAEAFFNFDSECVVQILNHYSEKELLGLRWKIALAGVHYLLEDFDFAITERITLLNQIKVHMFAEQGVGKEHIKWFKDKYRKETKMIDQIVQFRYEELESAFSLFRQRSQQLKPLIRKMRDLQQEGSLHLTMEYLIPSFLHMFLNRVFINKPRLQETVIYDLLHTYYSSLNARLKMKVPTS